MRKAVYVTAVLVIVFLMQLLVQGVNTAEANPFSMFNQIEPRPDAIPLKITIFSPRNNTAYSPDKIRLSFYVDRPNLDRKVHP
jgi:hypothetical protein